MGFALKKLVFFKRKDAFCMNNKDELKNKLGSISGDARKSGINDRQDGTKLGGETYGFDETNKREETGRIGGFSGDPSTMRKAPGYTNSVPGVNTPNISLPGYEGTPDVTIPAFNPPVPNRAWTEMRKNLKIESLSEEEKRRLYMGKDGMI